MKTHGQVTFSLVMSRAWDPAVTATLEQSVTQQVGRSFLQFTGNEHRNTDVIVRLDELS